MLREKGLTLSIWDSILGEALMSMRAVKSRATDRSPFEVCFSKKIKIPNDLVWEIPKEVAEIRRHIDVRKKMKDAQISYSTKVKENHDRKIKEKPLEINQMVYVRRKPEESIGSLEERLEGPFKIVDKKGEKVYIVDYKGKLTNMNRERLFT